MRVSPTSEQLDYLSSLGVCVTSPPAKAARVSGGREDDTASIARPPQTLRSRVVLGLIAGLCSGAVGLMLGGFFGLVTHGLLWGVWMAACTTVGWLMIGFLWSFGWTSDSELTDRINFEDSEIGIGVAMVLGMLAFGLCFCGMLVAVTLGGKESARAWVRGTLVVLWMIGFVPGIVLACYRLIRARRWNETPCE